MVTSQGHPSVLWHCWLGDRKGIRPVKNGVLVCWWWQFYWSFAHFTAPVVTITSIILSSRHYPVLSIQTYIPTNLRHFFRHLASSTFQSGFGNSLLIINFFTLHGCAHGGQWQCFFVGVNHMNGTASTVSSSVLSASLNATTAKVYFFRYSHNEADRQHSRTF